MVVDVERTRCLNSVTSSSVKVSALAMTGIKLTFVCNCRINSTSMGLRLRGEYDGGRGGLTSDLSVG
jgi:hypothetical protein